MGVGGCGVGNEVRPHPFPLPRETPGRGWAAVAGGGGRGCRGDWIFRRAGFVGEGQGVGVGRNGDGGNREQLLLDVFASEALSSPSPISPIGWAIPRVTFGVEYGL